MKRKSRPWRFIWAAMLALVLALVLAACSSPSSSPELAEPEAFFFSDADIDEAVFSVAEKTSELTGENLELEDVNNAPLGNLEELALDELSSQAVLPGAGGYIAFIRYNPGCNNCQWQLWLADQSNDRKTGLYAGSRAIESVATSLDGNTVIFAMRLPDGGNFEVYRLTISSGSVARLTNTSYDERNVSMSADGNTVVWQGQNAAGNRAAFIRQYSGTGFTDSVLGPGSADQFQPSVSGNGNFIALVRTASGANYVLLYDRTANSYRTVMGSSSPLAHPSPSDDGSKVAWRERWQSGQRILTRDMTTGTFRQIAYSSNGLEHPHLTADGNFLTFGLLLSGSWNIVTMNLSSGQLAHAVANVSPVHNRGPYWQKAATSSLTTVRVASGLTRPTAITHAGDGSGRLFITLQEGKVFVFDGQRILPEPFLDVSHLVSRGLMDIAFHPNYQNNRYFYINYVDKDINTVVARYRTRSGNPNAANPNSAKTILKIDEATSNHWGGQTKFGPDGYLYISVGDGGPQGDPNNHSQNRGNLLGAMLRIDVDGGDPYSVPSSNPFVSTAGARGEIWAYGLRNPWRFSFDRRTGDLFIGDVGYNAREEINFQPASSRGGENYGWRKMEGSLCFNPATNCDDGTLVLPILEYDTGENCSITGGYRYRGQRISGLGGTYLYGDFCSGRIWGATPQGGGWSSRQLLNTSYSIVTFGEDEAGEVYFADHANGGIYRLESK